MKTNRSRPRVHDWLITSFCALGFCAGVMFTTTSLSQEIPSSPNKAAPQATEPNRNPNDQDSWTIVDSVSNAENKVEQGLVKAVELAHATFFAILVLNTIGLLVFAGLKLWPRRVNGASKSIILNDEIRINQNTVLSVVQVYDKEYLIVKSSNSQSVIPIEPKMPEAANPATQNTKSDKLTTSERVTEAEVNAAVRSMIAGK